MYNDENKNVIEQLNDKIEFLEEKIERLIDLLEMSHEFDNDDEEYDNDYSDEELDNHFNSFANPEIIELINKVGDIEKPVPLGMALLRKVPAFRKLALKAGAKLIFT